MSCELAKATASWTAPASDLRCVGGKSHRSAIGNPKVYAACLVEIRGVKLTFRGFSIMLRATDSRRPRSSAKVGLEGSAASSLRIDSGRSGVVFSAMATSRAQARGRDVVYVKYFVSFSFLLRPMFWPRFFSLVSEQ
jgi:hypothetical protein